MGDLAKREAAGCLVPDYITVGDVRGTENIGKDDIKFPALKLAQDTTPEVKRHEAAFIEGLRSGELFNSVTRDNYGEGTIQFLIVNQLGHRNVEFDPTDRNVIVDGRVPDNDPRCQFSEMVKDGKTIRVNPVAVKFYDYLLLVMVDGFPPQLMTMSLKKTQLKKAVQLNSVLVHSKLPSFAHLFKGTPVPESKGQNSWYGWRFDRAGFPSPALYKAASDFYDKYAGAPIAVEAETEPEVTDTDIPF